MAIEHRDVRLSDRHLRLTFLGKGRLVIGQLLEGSFDADNLLLLLDKEGIRDGLIESGIDLITKGTPDEVPLATARVIEVPAGITNIGLTHPVVDEVAASGNMDALSELDITFPVKAGQRLITVDTPPRIIERLPTGESRILHEGESIDAHLFSGAHTSVDKGGHAILADIDGWAHRNNSGEVAVYPVERIPGTRRAHILVQKKATLLFEQDVGDGSQVETAADIKVQGTVRGTFMEAAGNIHIGFRADNPADTKDARIQAGQSLRARQLTGVTVWVGSHLIVTEEVSDCEIECLDTIITPLILSSKIKVGHRLIVRDLRGSSQIELGIENITNPDMNDKIQIHSQHAKRLEDIDRALSSQHSTYEKTRQNLIKQIALMRGSGQSSGQRQKGIQILRRQYNVMELALNEFKKAYDDFTAVVDLLAQEQVGLDHYRHLQASFNAPHIVVTGTLAAGTVIQGPTDKIKPDKDLSNVRIHPDPHTGQLITTPL